ncbi:putative HD superfamily hydrolase involved in NAD metabolism [Desulfitispora alkaliphila]|uniref:bis(5'-nucleosyl)-tetraphosphatase (symmetrical) YqeK n=1 Tax=Desulfitispora alkaliphila TaxID=622674 RepID=UPI003D2578F7
MENRKLQEVIKGRLSPKRYAHSCAVAATAEKLAKIYGVNGEKAYIAGLLHDYAREIEPEKLLTIATEAGLVTDQVEEENPLLLHGSVGALLVKRDLDITEQDILNAIAHHTLGRPGMSLMEMVIYISDVIEPSRDFPCIDEIRERAERKMALNEITVLILKQTISYNLNKGMIIHPQSIRAINYYQKIKDMESRG